LWFKNNLWCLDCSDQAAALASRTARWIKEDTSRRDRVLKLIRDADFGISEISLAETQILQEDLSASTELNEFQSAVRRLLESVGKSADSLRRYEIYIYH